MVDVSSFHGFGGRVKIGNFVLIRKSVDLIWRFFDNCLRGYFMD